MGGLSGNCCFDERDHFTQGFAKNGVVLSDLIEVASGIVLFPELFGQRLSCFRKLSELWVERAGLCQESAQVVGFDQLPSVMDQIGFEKTLSSFVKQLDPTP